MHPTSPDTDQPVDTALVESIRMATLGIDASSPITFPGGGRVDYEAWLHDTFRNTLAPHALAVASWAQKGHAKEICQADADLQLGNPDLDGPSTTAGKAILDARRGTQSCPTLDKLRAAVETDITPGHHATLFAVQAALNHIPHHGILLGLAYDEWRSATGNPGISHFLPLLDITSSAAAGACNTPAPNLRIA